MTNVEESPKKQLTQMRDYPQELEEHRNGLREWFRNAAECKVEVWRYHHFWQWFALRVQEGQSERKLYLSCRWCDHIEAPTVWHSPNFEIALSNSDNSKFIFRDVNVGFRVECRAVNLSEESWWFFENIDIMQPPKKWSAEDAAKLKKTSSSFWEEMQHRRIDVDSLTSSPQEVISFVEEWVSRCATVKVSISSYRQSSQLLDFRLQAVGEKRNIHIVCEGCHYFKSSPWAEDVKLEISVSQSEPVQWLVRDENANILIKCDILKLSINVQPLSV